MIKNWFNSIGPGALVAAAFIGPGTVTMCTLAGVGFGYELIWALVISIIATLVLQEMAARLGLVSQKGLATVVRENIQVPVVRFLALFLILGAIVIGNAAYEAGNISGGVLGLETVFGNFKYGELNILSVLIGLLAAVLLFIGNYKLIERALVTLVAVMSLTFVVTAILTKPNILDLLKGFFIPSLDETKLLTVVGLVGTTVVPYNLFLHASLVKERWSGKENLGSDLAAARKDTYISILLGGLVSLAIIVCAAAIYQQNQASEVRNAADLAISLEPLLGSVSKYFLAIGLFAAGLTSAITAPLAAAYVASHCLGWNSDLKATRFRLVWAFILIVGVVFSSIGFKSIEIIRFAQITNGVLLPVIALFLLWAMNQTKVLGQYVNSTRQNLLGGLIVLFSLFLGAKGLAKVLGLY